MHNPEVLFLDEPTSGLDPVSRTRIWEEVQRLNAAGITIFLTTQYLEEADALAHRVGIIDHGLIIAEDTPDSLKRQYGADVIVAELDVESDIAPACAALEALPGIDRVDRHGREITIVTRDAGSQLSPVAIALSACNASVANLTMRRPSLDDVYLQLTGAHLELDHEDSDVENAVRSGATRAEDKAPR
jgi:ABC-2 type transport system ATP-binding protein